MRLLYIEDNPSDAILVRLALAECGSSAALTHAPDGETGLALLEQETYDLLLLDLHMPRLNGWDILRALQGQPHLPPVVVLTSSAADSASGETEALGAAECLVKPLNLEDLFAVIEGLAARWLVSSLPLTTAEKASGMARRVN